MPYAALVLGGLLPLLAAAYAHLRLSRDVPRLRDRWTSRALLLGVAIAFGATMAGYYFGGNAVQRGLVFLGAFGITHVPAAAILFLKHRAARDR